MTALMEGKLHAYQSSFEIPLCPSGTYKLDLITRPTLDP